MVQEDSTQKSTGKLVDLKLPFPWKLHKLLEDTENNQTTDIVSWLPDGASFKVHKPKVFTDEIMPSYFSQTKFNSFRRQCYIYGFRLGRDGGFSHPSFRRDDLDACLSLRRNQQEDRRRKKKHDDTDKISPLYESNHFRLPSSLNVSTLSYLPRGSSSMTSSSQQSSTMVSSEEGPTLFEQTFVCSSRAESKDGIMDLADKIFENSQYFNEFHAERLGLDFTFQNVQLDSLDEVFLSEIFSEPTPTERQNGGYSHVVAL